MSWVRFSPESNLYIFDDVRGGITCCACRLQPMHGTIIPEVYLPGDFNCQTEQKMAAHILEHAKAGHLVPDYIVERAKEIDPSLVFPEPSRLLTLLRIAGREVTLQIRIARSHLKTWKIKRHSGGDV